MLSCSTAQTRIGILLAVMAVGACACKSRQRARLNPKTGTTGGVLVFSDDFERTEIGKDWLNRSGKWVIKDGMLHGQNDRNEGIWLNTPVPDRFRIEFDARADSAEGDLKFEVCASEQHHQTGYIVIMGGWNNSLSIIARLNEHGTDRLESDMRGETGRVYHMMAVRTDRSLLWYVDGKLALTFEDEDPLHGRFFAFNDWSAPVAFDNLKIFQL
ncbi:MAG: hypothetical protein GXP54_03745 [Deltaproteobacteria bacterium]|nr:hypothetical protein [Deltaproteobacteria bacterium]